MEELLRKSQAVSLAPNDCTKQGLLDSLGDCGKGAILDGKPFDYHFLHASVAELSNFMAKYDLELAGILTDLWDCRSFNDEKKRSGAGKLIPYPGISLLVGTATENLGNTIPNEMWGSGFMARVIMVYSAEEVIPKDMFVSNPRSEELATAIALGFRKIGALKGPVKWEPETQRLLMDFRINSKKDAPLHNRLEHYGIRRWMHLAKVIMVSALSDQRMVITPEDFHRALAWLTEAEGFMPEVFKGMNTHEDGAIYEEMRSQMFGAYLRGNRNPIPASVLYAFLSTRVGSHSVERMVEIAVAAGYFNRCAGTSGHDAMYIPQPPLGTKMSGVI